MGVDDMLDVMLAVLFLGLLTGISFRLIMPLSDMEVWGFTSRFSDKAAPAVIGEWFDGTTVEGYDGCMDGLEVMLATQILDFAMPEPKKLKLPTGAVLDIDNGYRDTYVIYANSTYTSIKSDLLTGRFYFKHDYGVHTVADDDSYILIKK